MWSLFNHHFTANQLRYDALNLTLGRVGPEIGRPPEDPVTYFRDWLANDGAPFWSFWETPAAGGRSGICRMSISYILPI